MLWRTHVLLGASAGLLVVGHTDLKTAVTSAAIAGAAALVPDLDSPDSKLGRMVPIIPWVFKNTIGHRGPMHSLLGVAVLLALSVFALRFWYSPEVVYGQVAPLVTVGMVSHLVGDSFTPGGVPWLWPIKYHVKLPLVQTGSILERLVVTPATLLLCIWLGYNTVIWG